MDQTCDGEVPLGHLLLISPPPAPKRILKQLNDVANEEGEVDRLAICLAKFAQVEPVVNNKNCSAHPAALQAAQTCV
jgi:hypothetical protein